MAKMIPDQTFYPSPSMATQAPPETIAYVAMLNPHGGPDALTVIDVDNTSKAYGHEVHQVDMPNAGDELHHFGWNACSSCLCPFAAHPHMERRYLIVPGLRSSRIHILDTKADPRKPRNSESHRAAGVGGFAANGSASVDLSISRTTSGGTSATTR